MTLLNLCYQSPTGEYVVSNGSITFAEGYTDKKPLMHKLEVPLTPGKNSSALFTIHCNKHKRSDSVTIRLKEVQLSQYYEDGTGFCYGFQCHNGVSFWLKLFHPSTGKLRFPVRQDEICRLHDSVKIRFSWPRRYKGSPITIPGFFQFLDNGTGVVYSGQCYTPAVQFGESQNTMIFR